MFAGHYETLVCVGGMVAMCNFCVLCMRVQKLLLQYEINVLMLVNMVCDCI